MSRMWNQRWRANRFVRAVTGCGLAALVLIPATRAAAMPVAHATQAGRVSSGKSSSEHASSKSGTLFGTTVASVSDLKKKTAEFGQMPIVHVYYTGLPSSNAWSGGVASANHSAVNVAFNAPPQTIISGADDATLRHFFDTAPQSYPIYYTYRHDFERYIDQGKFNATQYKEAWVKIVQLADAAHNPDLHSTLTLMAYDLDPSSHRNWKSYIPSGGIISTLAWEAYPPGGYGTPAPSASWLGPVVSASHELGLPFAIAEFGTVTIPGRAAWLTSVADFLRSNGAVFCTVFDATEVGGLAKHGGSFLLTDQASINAWRAVIHGS